MTTPHCKLQIKRSLDHGCVPIRKPSTNCLQGTKGQRPSTSHPSPGSLGRSWECFSTNLDGQHPALCKILIVQNVCNTKIMQLQY